MPQACLQSPATLDRQGPDARPARDAAARDGACAAQQNLRLATRYCRAGRHQACLAADFVGGAPKSPKIARGLGLTTSRCSSCSRRPARASPRCLDETIEARAHRAVSRAPATRAPAPGSASYDLALHATTRSPPTRWCCGSAWEGATPLGHVERRTRFPAGFLARGGGCRRGLRLAQLEPRRRDGPAHGVRATPGSTPRSACATARSRCSRRGGSSPPAESGARSPRARDGTRRRSSVPQKMIQPGHSAVHRRGRSTPTTGGTCIPACAAMTLAVTSGSHLAREVRQAASARRAPASRGPSAASP